MRRILGIVFGLLATTCGAMASGGGSGAWAESEVHRNVADGWSRTVHGVRVRVYNAEIGAGGGFGCKIDFHATPAGAVLLADSEKLTLRFYDSGGSVLEARGGIGFHVGGNLLKNGKIEISLGTGGPPPGTASLSIELECLKLETRTLRLPPAGAAK